jgi:hypothetical protein
MNVDRKQSITNQPSEEAQRQSQRNEALATEGDVLSGLDLSLVSSQLLSPNHKD